MPEAKKYTGGCHCGKVRYEVSTDLATVADCNCSICSRRGWVLTFSSADNFKLLSGEDALTDYQFGKKNIHHLFCSTCGVSSFSTGTGRDGSKMYSVNLRCLDGVDLGALPIHHFDGKSL